LIPDYGNKKSCFHNQIYKDVKDDTMNREKILTYGCPVETAMEIIGGKYKVIIIWNLADKTLRYNELKKAIPQVTPKMLSQQLKDLEADGIINRILYPVVPPKTEYSLTELGKSLVPIIKDLCRWGEEYFASIAVPGSLEREGRDG